jgi:pimeloyl-ACP methyl ester carboxylesterase
MAATTRPLTIERPGWLDEEMWPFAVQTCATTAGPVAYTDTGDGPTLLFVHLGFWSFVWRDVLAHLCASFRCVTLDAPGTGLTLAGPPGLNEAAGAIDGLVTTLDLHDITLVVHDLGGPAALEAAARWPERVGRLAAVNTFGWQPRGVPFVGMLGVMGSAPMRCFDTATGFLPRAASTRMGVGRHLDRAARRTFRRGVDGRGRASFHRYMRSARLHDYQAIDAVLAALADRPVLTIFGARNDPLRFQRKWRERFANAHQVLVPKGNHFPMNDDPTLVAREIAAWHARTSPQ